MLGTYAAALRVPGAVRFSSTGFVARLPVAMVGLGIVLLVSGRTDSYALAGVLSAAFILPAALGAVATSRLTDRLGQARLLPWLAALNAVFLSGFVLLVEASAPVVLQGLVAAGAGACQPAIGSMVRARWAAHAPDSATLRSAFALESIVDEAVFTVGPLATAFLAFQAGLPIPLLLAAAIGLVGGLALAMQRRTQPPVAPRPVQAHESGPAAIRQPGVVFVVSAALGVGSVFGSFEVAVVAFTQQAGTPGVSGIILAVWAFGSMMGGIWFGARNHRLSLGRQMLVLPATLAIVLIPASLAPSTILLGVATVLGGLAVAPTLIASFSLTERLVPTGQLTEGLTLTNSGLAVGFAGGTALAGFLVDALGSSAGFALSITGAAFAAFAGLLGQSTFVRALHVQAPPLPHAALTPDPLPGPQPGGVMDDPR